MSFVTYFKSYPNPYYSDWRGAPIPGWGARPVMAGPRMVAVGAFDAESAGCGTTAVDFKATQNALKDVGMTDGENKPIVADGDFGNRSKQAFAKWEARFKADPKFGQLGISLPCDGLFYEAECKRDPSKCKAGEGAVPQTTAATTPASDAAAPPPPPRTKKGDKGPAVKAWQVFLISQGYDLGAGGADGDHGDKTEYASLDWESKQAQAAKGQPAAQEQAPVKKAAVPLRMVGIDRRMSLAQAIRLKQLAAIRGYARPKPPPKEEPMVAPSSAPVDRGARASGGAVQRSPQRDESGAAVMVAAPVTEVDVVQQTAEVPIYKKPLFYVGVAAALGIVGFAAYKMTQKT